MKQKLNFAGPTVWLTLIVLAVGPVHAQRGPAVVEILRVEERDVVMTQATLGTIMPTHRAVIGSAVDGRVVQLRVREGDRVKRDEALASLLTATISLELEAAKAELKLRRQELLELKNGSLPDEIEQAKARLEASRVAADYLERDTQRLSKLGINSAISVSEIENSSSRWLEAQQRHIEARAAYQLAVEGPRPEKIKQAEFRRDMQKAVVKRLRDQIAKHTMFSRFAGYVTIEHTEVGQWLPRGEPVAEIIALDEVDVLAKVLEAHIPYIHVGDEVHVEVPAVAKVLESQIPYFHISDEVLVEVPAVAGRQLSGVIEAIIPEADERSRTFPVKIRVANLFSQAGEPLLKAGMLARVVLPTGDKKMATMVHKDALVLDGRKTMIWSVDASSTAPAQGAAGMLEANAIPIPVETGVEQGEWIEVLGDVPADADIVVRGNERIPPARPGAPPSRITWKKATS